MEGDGFGRRDLLWRRIELTLRCCSTLVVGRWTHPQGWSDTKVPSRDIPAIAARASTSIFNFAFLRLLGFAAQTATKVWKLLILLMSIYVLLWSIPVPAIYVNDHMEACNDVTQHCSSFGDAPGGDFFPRSYHPWKAFYIYPMYHINVSLGSMQHFFLSRLDNP